MRREIIVLKIDLRKLSGMQHREVKRWEIQKINGDTEARDSNIREIMDGDNRIEATLEEVKAENFQI